MKATLTLPLNRRIDIPGVPGVHRTIVGVVSARALVDDLLLDERGDRRLHLYDENVRDYLGTVGNEVNSAITATLQDDVHRRQFPVLNNGVTIVVRSLVDASPKHIVLRGPRVVNGCQTCNVLALNKELLTDDVLVNVRIIETDVPDVVGSIVRATNQQTAMTSDAFDARDGFQKEVEDFCASQPEGTEVYFERRIEQYGARARVISRRHLAQAYAAMWLDCPHVVGRYRGLIAGRNGAIFEKGQDPLYYYLAAAAYLNVGRLIQRGVPPQYRPARFQLLYALRLLAFGDQTVTLGGGELDRRSNVLLDVLWDLGRLRSVIEQLLPVIDRSLGSGVSLSDLGAEMRTAAFTERFRRALLESPAPEGERWEKAA
jgi:hypothetical protein